MLETSAEKIVIEDETVTGVVLADGTHLKARGVISNASMPATMKMLTGNIEPAKFADKAE